LRDCDIKLALHPRSEASTEGGKQESCNLESNRNHHQMVTILTFILYQWTKQYLKNLVWWGIIQVWQIWHLTVNLKCITKQNFNHAQ